MFVQRDGAFSASSSHLHLGEQVRRERITSVVKETGREIELDFLRGLAILMVVDFHAPVKWMSRPFQRMGFPDFGWAGVSIFFVLSGFLVGGLLVKEWKLRHAIDSKRFLVRRGFKIWPQYYVFLLVALLTGHHSLHALWGNLLNIQNYVGGVPHTWSLAVEEHAYLLLVIGLSLAARYRVQPRVLAISIAGLCGAIACGRLLLIEHGYEVMNRTHTRIDGILYGVLLALLYHFRPEIFHRWQQRRWIWVCSLLLAVTFLRFQDSSRWATSIGWDAATLLGVSLLMLLYRAGRGKPRPAWYRFVAWIGVYSYGIYLWHVAAISPTLTLAAHVPGPWVPVWLALAPLVAGITLGVLATRVVELPALALRDRLYPRRVDSPIGTPAEVEARSSAVPASQGSSEFAEGMGPRPWKLVPSSRS